MRVVVVGQGYVGLPLAMRAAEVGPCVVGYDVDTNRVKRLAAGESYVEDVSAAQLQSAVQSGQYTVRLRVSDRHAEANLAQTYACSVPLIATRRVSR